MPGPWSHNSLPSSHVRQWNVNQDVYIISNGLMVSHKDQMQNLLKNGSVYSLCSHFLLPRPAVDISKMVAALEILWFDCGLAWIQIIGSEFDHIRHLMPQAEQRLPMSMVARCTTALTGDRILQTPRVHDSTLHIGKVARLETHNGWVWPIMYYYFSS